MHRILLTQFCTHYCFSPNLDGGIKNSMRRTFLIEGICPASKLKIENTCESFEVAESKLSR